MCGVVRKPAHDMQPVTAQISMCFSQSDQSLHSENNINRIALKTAKPQWSFGHSQSIRIKIIVTGTINL